jgi:hypothetical protein
LLLEKAWRLMAVYPDSYYEVVFAGRIAAGFDKYPSDFLAGYDYIVWPFYFSIRTGCADDGFRNRDRTSKS